MITDVVLQEKVIEEIYRLSEIIMDAPMPVEEKELFGLVINMLTGVFLENITLEEFVVLTMQIPNTKIGLYYQELFEEELK